VRSWPLNRYVVGDRKATCARCGFDYLLSQLVEEERTNTLVCSHCYDPPHPQDNRRTSAGGYGYGTGGSTPITPPDEAAFVDEP